MKRIESACLEQTCHFEDEEDYRLYIEKLDKKGTRYIIVEKETRADNAVAVKLKLQYQNYDTGSYLC